MITPDIFDKFNDALSCPDLLPYLRGGLIGEDVMIGNHKLIYADYVASGRALHQIETLIMNDVLPYYSNSHTEASYCGQMMTRLRQKARKIIKEACGGDTRHDVIFTGTGATSGINRLVSLLGANHPAKSPLVILGPYEHHSNILPWRESGAEIVEIVEAPQGGPDLAQLEAVLVAAKGRHIIGSFSAASNVTGIVTDVERTTRLLKSYNALSVWDYAGAGPYLPIEMGEIDAIVISAHKFIGGPAASGVLILKRDAVLRNTPSLPGGGTVRFVSPWAHDYSRHVIAREEAGTPNVIGDLRAALCFMVKSAIGTTLMKEKLNHFRNRAIERWKETPNLEILGNQHAENILPIFSFRMKDSKGAYIHQQLVTRALSDYFGIQARGGCACTGPYAHRLLDIDREGSEIVRKSISDGNELDKPGWTRLGFSVLMTEQKVDKIIAAVHHLACAQSNWQLEYTVDPSTARFTRKVI